jgi:hypothetical protein
MKEMWLMREILLWLVAALITIMSVAVQKKTGPTESVKGVVAFNGTAVKYELLRSFAGEGDQPVIVQVADTAMSGVCIYRRYKTNDPWSVQPMIRVQDNLSAFLPHQPPAGKLEYHVELTKEGQTFHIPEDRSVVTRFRGNVPAAVFLPHIIFVFFAMLVSMRTGLETLGLRSQPEEKMHKRLKIYTLSTIILLFIGGIIYGPLMQKYAFNAYWTGVPFGFDLTDNKTLIAIISWLLAVLYLNKFEKLVFRIRIASLITLMIFMIPHSFMGSELNYQKLDQAKASQVQSEK